MQCVFLLRKTPFASGPNSYIHGLIAKPHFGFNVSSMEVQNPDDHSGINISDVIEVIETDAAFGSMNSRRPSSEGVANAAFVKIIEQPAPKALRFRYECEGRSAGSLPGINSSPENKTFPTIQIVGYKGPAVVIVSCVTKDPPYRPHPHNLVGKEYCNRGVCTVKVNVDSMTATFANLGIQCVKKKDIEEALKVREEIRVDPFRTGFSHKTQASSIDLNSVRLCFQAFLEGPRPGKFTNPLKPVVSDPIYDKKAMADLVICKLSHCSASVAGGQEVILLCEKVAKEDISVRFFEEKDGQIVWEGYGDFTPTQVHKQTAIAFRTPRYKLLEETPAYFTRNRAKVLAVQNVEEIPPPPDSEITIPGPLGDRESTRRELEYSGGSDEDYVEDRSVDSLEVTDTSANTQLKSVMADVDVMKNTPIQIEQPIQASIQLRRPSDGETSEALPFQITPLDPDPQMLKRKRQKYSSEKLSDMDPMRMLKNESMMPVKREPVTSPNPHQLVVSMRKQLSPHYSRTPSPLEYSQAAGVVALQGAAGSYQLFQQAGGAVTYITSSSTGGGHVYSNYSGQAPTVVQPLQPVRQEYTNILDMDTQQQQYSLELNLGSKEFVDLQLLEGSLPNNFSSSLVLGPDSHSLQQVNNNTDSFTRLANAAYNDLC